MGHEALHFEELMQEHESQIADHRLVVCWIIRVLPIDHELTFVRGIDLKHSRIEKASIELAQIFIRALKEKLFNDLLVAELIKEPTSASFIFIHVGLQQIHELRNIGLVLRTTKDSEVELSSEFEYSEFKFFYFFWFERKTHISGFRNIGIRLVLWRALRSHEIKVVILC